MLLLEPLVRSPLIRTLLVCVAATTAAWSCQPGNGTPPSSPAAPSPESGPGPLTSASDSERVTADTELLDVRSADFRALAESIPDDRRQQLVLSVLRARLPASVTAQGFQTFFMSEDGQTLEAALREDGVPPGTLNRLIEAVFSADPVVELTRDEGLYQDSVRVGLEAHLASRVVLPDELIRQPMANQRRPDSCAEYRHCEADHQIQCTTLAEVENLYLKVAAEAACKAAAACTLGVAFVPPLGATCAKLGIACLAAGLAYKLAYRQSYGDCVEAHCIGVCEVK